MGGTFTRSGALGRTLPAVPLHGGARRRAGDRHQRGDRELYVQHHLQLLVGRRAVHHRRAPVLPRVAPSTPPTTRAGTAW